MPMLGPLEVLFMAAIALHLFLLTRFGLGPYILLRVLTRALVNRPLLGLVAVAASIVASRLRMRRRATADMACSG